MALLLETLYGDLIIDLDVEGSPELCKNVIKLAYCRYYTNTLIFNVTAQRFCQLGCPTGDGTGGACIYGLVDAVKEQQQNSKFDYKLSKHRFLKSIGRPLTASECQEKGRVVATLMNFTPDTIGSQFLITTASGPDHALDCYRHNTGGNAVAILVHSKWEWNLTPSYSQRTYRIHRCRYLIEIAHRISSKNLLYWETTEI
jgi:cyclophilin family peptidyl-prolyl cis-trans isomerase